MPLIIALENKDWLRIRGLKTIAEKAYAASLTAVQRKKTVTLLFTDDATLKSLNKDWRGKNKPTNVLSFPASPDLIIPRGEAKPLGDIALAFETVLREAEDSEKTLKDHTAHLIVHGILHLLGFDHISDGEAAVMEAREIRILKKLGIADPYRVNSGL